MEGSSKAQTNLQINACAGQVNNILYIFFFFILSTNAVKNLPRSGESSSANKHISIHASERIATYVQSVHVCT